MVFSLITWFQELFLGKSKDNSLVGLCQLKEANQPVYNTCKQVKNSKNIKISDLMRGDY